MPSNKCVVVGCNTTYMDKHTTRHRFPKDQATCNVWVQKSGTNPFKNF